MNEFKAESQAERDAEERYIENQTCEKCGGETGEKMVGDEIYQKCGDCGLVTMK